jgi:membrane-associated phospholipid phosphatase
MSQNADIDLLRNINLNRNKSLDPAFRFITNSVTPLTIIVPVGYITASLIKKDSALNCKTIIISSSALIAAVVSTTLKYGVKRVRPFVRYPDLEKAGSGGSPSFPSGHTSSAFSLATSISICYPKWYTIAPSYLWACSVAYSRMDLGVHYPSDVLAGAIIGAGSSFLSYKINQHLTRKK